MSPFMSELLLPTCSWTTPPESCQGCCTICRLAWSESQLSWHPPAREEGEREICALRFLWCLCWNDCITHVIPCNTMYVYHMHKDNVMHMCKASQRIKSVHGSSQPQFILFHSAIKTMGRAKKTVNGGYTCIYMYINACTCSLPL